ncbi:MAG: serine/threonine protein kinase, partial [Acidobacteria bacterium]|nr:serine/threonine protein kinase [Acidobacteriota bacterium]
MRREDGPAVRRRGGSGTLPIGPPGKEELGPVTLIAGRYRLGRRLGRGVSGEVVQAEDLRLGQAVALKFLSPAWSREPRIRQRFLDEVRFARQVSHPNVCRVHDVEEFDGNLFLSMELVEGEDLRTVLSRGALEAEQAAEVAIQICAGLAAIHERGLLHRDLKPGN